MNGKTLTAEQCSKLSLYILMTTKTREGEAEAWEKLAEEKKEDGSPRNISTPPTTRSFGESSTQTSAKYFGIWRREHEQLPEYHGKPGGAGGVPRLYPGD
jgi:hypothetical protein